MIASRSALSVNLLPILTALAVMNAVLPAAVEHVYQLGIVGALLNGFGQSFIIWLSIAIAVWLWNQSSPPTESPRATIVILSAVLSLSLVIPLATTAWIVTVLLALLWHCSYVHDRYSRAAVVLVLALSIREPATRLLLTLCSSEILGFDATIAALFLEASGRQFDVVGNLIVQENGYSLLILTGCSAFGNLSLSLLLWAALTLMLQQQFVRTDSVRVVAAAMLVIALNSLRLALMALGPGWYNLLHEGLGASMHELGAMLLTLACVRWKSCYENDANHTNDSVSRSCGCTGDTAA